MYDDTSCAIQQMLSLNKMQMDCNGMKLSWMSPVLRGNIHSPSNWIDPCELV